MSEHEAFHEYGEMVFEPVLSRARESYYEAADSERAASDRVRSIEKAEAELRIALDALAKIKEAVA